MNILLTLTNRKVVVTIPGMMPSAEEQLTSGHISPFNDGQGFFAQFDPSKAWWDGQNGSESNSALKK